MGRKRPITFRGIQFERVVNAALHFNSPLSAQAIYNRLHQSDDLEWVFGLKEKPRGTPNRKAISEAHNFLIASPAAAAEWDHEKNHPLTPEQVTPGSGKRVWWRCSLNSSHEWQTAVRDRAPPKNNRCPFCSGKRASTANRLIDHYPEVASQFAQDLNPGVDLNDISMKSGKKLWWRCQTSEAHTWKARVADRVNDKTGCPCCSGRIAHAGRNLATQHPVVACEFDIAKNAPLTAADLTPASGKTVWWRCSKNPIHTWRAAVSMRTVQGTGCPGCDNKKAFPDNCLQTVYPDISNEWHPTKNNGLTPNDVVAGSHTRVWWKCPKGPDHEWQTTVDKRTKERTGCPYCGGQRLSVTNRLDTVRPDIAALLVPELNPPNAAASVFYTDTARKLWFRCKENSEHIFQTRPSYFTANNGSCPVCKRSHLETLVESVLVEEKISFVREWREHELRHKKKLSFDFFLPELSAVIECDGEQHFKPMNFDKGRPEPLRLRQKRDDLKNAYCEKHEIALLRVRFDAEDPAGIVRDNLAHWKAARRQD